MSHVDECASWVRPGSLSMGRGRIIGGEKGRVRGARQAETVMVSSKAGGWRALVGSALLGADGEQKKGREKCGAGRAGRKAPSSEADVVPSSARL